MVECMGVWVYVGCVCEWMYGCENKINRQNVRTNDLKILATGNSGGGRFGE